MTAEIISVGTEILLGNIVNTNACYLAGQFAGLGLSSYYQTVVGDNMERLKSCIKTAMERSDIIILSGGLGPTKDDLTKEAVAEVVGLPLVEDARSRQRIADYFESTGRTPTENNWKQALVPKGSDVIDNDNGTAPGIAVHTEEGRHLFLLPGPPDELVPMFETSVIPMLRRLSEDVIVSVTAKICGPGESAVETEIRDMIDEQSNPTIAPYAKIGEVHLRITARAESEAQAQARNRPVAEELMRRFGNNIYTFDEKETMEACLIHLLEEKQMTITAAESCTGGLLAARLVNVAGASSVFRQSAVTYSNEAKQKLLGVPEETLAAWGAVSRQTAEAMARGAAAAAGADVALSVTGIAGPDGGTKEKPVGLVYIGCFIRGHVEVMECHFRGNREKIREQTVIRALNMARINLLQEK